MISKKLEKKAKSASKKRAKVDDLESEKDLLKQKIETIEKQAKSAIETTIDNEPAISESNSPTIKQETPGLSTTMIKNQISIFPRIGFGMNFNSGYGIITGGSIIYSNNKWGNIGADLMYLINSSKHTFGMTGFYERKIFKNIVLRGGLSYLKTGDVSNIGVAAGAGMPFSIGKMFIIQPMAEVSFGSSTNNIMGINFNMGILF